MNREDFPTNTRSLLEHPLRVEWLYSGYSGYQDLSWPGPDWQTDRWFTDLGVERRIGRVIAFGVDRVLVVQDGTDTLALMHPDMLHVLASSPEATRPAVPPAEMEPMLGKRA